MRSTTVGVTCPRCHVDIANPLTRLAAWLDRRALQRIQRRASRPILRHTARDLETAQAAGAWDSALATWSADA